MDTSPMDTSHPTGMAFQDRYPESYAHCFGCGRLNEEGLHVKSRWVTRGEEAVCHVDPPQRYSGGIPGMAYGGIIASLMDCHAAGTAAAAAADADGTPEDQPVPRFVTGSLRVDYLAPTPLGVTLEVRARVREMSGRKVVLDVSLGAGGAVTATGEALMVRLRDDAPTG